MNPMRDRIYATPAAFRTALTDRINTLAAAGPWTAQHLQRQFAYDRLLERLYLVDDGWIVKGATALLAREIGVRASLDVDVYRPVSREVAEADLRRAVGLDIDWIAFVLGAPEPIGDDGEGVRVKVSSFIGASEWVSFSIDLVGSDLRMTGVPEDVPPLVRGVMPDVAQRGYRAYPIVDHVADKRRPTSCTARVGGRRRAIAISSTSSPSRQVRPSTRSNNSARSVRSSRDGSSIGRTTSRCQTKRVGVPVTRRRPDEPSSPSCPRSSMRSPSSARSSTRCSAEQPRGAGPAGAGANPTVPDRRDRDAFSAGARESGGR
jgi:hypothetical protein